VSAHLGGKKTPIGTQESLKKKIEVVFLTFLGLPNKYFFRNLPVQKNNIFTNSSPYYFNKYLLIYTAVYGFTLINHNLCQDTEHLPANRHYCGWLLQFCGEILATSLGAAGD
tara:strand:- start:1291 stop:1626 length:336 start_codon:yes stop_codon:yes gene_type:complete